MVEPADHHRRDGERDQRQRHHPRALVRRCHARDHVVMRVIVLDRERLVAGMRSSPWNVMNTSRKRVERRDEHADQHAPVGVGRARAGAMRAPPR